MTTLRATVPIKRQILALLFIYLFMVSKTWQVIVAEQVCPPDHIRTRNNHLLTRLHIKSGLGQQQNMSIVLLKTLAA